VAKSTVGMPKDDMMGFTVFKPETKPAKLTHKEIYFSTNKTGTRLSMKALSVMGSPDAVLVMFDIADRMLVVPATLAMPNALYLACAGQGKNYKNLLKAASLKAEILGRLGRDAESFKGLLRCPGKKIERVDGNAILFNLKDAVMEKEE
jgi:hypothetical protein